MDLQFLTYEDARQLKEEIENLLDSPGWKWFIRFNAERVQLRKNELYQYCPESIEGLAKFNRLKGGLDEAEYLPKIIEQVYSDLVEQIKKQQLAESEADDSQLNLEGI